MAIELLESHGDLYRHLYAPEEIARFREFWSVRDERERATARLER
jgi:hypothetical protein